MSRKYLSSSWYLFRPVLKSFIRWYMNMIFFKFILSFRHQCCNQDPMSAFWQDRFILLYKMTTEASVLLKLKLMMENSP